MTLRLREPLRLIRVNKRAKALPFPTGKGTGVRFVLLAQVGISHHSAPIDVRERLTCPPDALPDFLDALTAIPGIREAAILSTCNRMEVYAVSDLPAEETSAVITRRVAEGHNLP